MPNRRKSQNTCDQNRRVGHKTAEPGSRTGRIGDALRQPCVLELLQSRQACLRSSVWIFCGVTCMQRRTEKNFEWKTRTECEAARRRTRLRQENRREVAADDTIGF